MSKPQVILRIEDEHGIHFIKKWSNGQLSIEGHTEEAAKSHNANTPSYFFPIDEETAIDEFRKVGKEYKPTKGSGQ